MPRPPNRVSGTLVPTCRWLDRRVDKGDKPKRAPSAYNLFVQAKMKEWKENNTGAPIKEAMVEVGAHTSTFLFVSRSRQIGAMWRDAPENPNRGKEPKSRKPKASVAKSVPKAKKPPPKSSDAEQSGEESEWYYSFLSDDDDMLTFFFCKESLFLFVTVFPCLSRICMYALWHMPNRRFLSRDTRHTPFHMWNVLLSRMTTVTICGVVRVYLS